MNRLIIFCSLNFACLFLQAQPLTEAMRLYEAANALTPCSPQRYEQLTQAVALLENEPFVAEKLLLRSALAAETNCNDQAAGQKACLAVLEQAKTELSTDDHPFLLEAYLVFVQTQNYQQPEIAIYYAKLALKYVPKPSPQYFKLVHAFYYASELLGKANSMSPYLKEMKANLESPQGENLKSFWAMYYNLEASYNFHVNNYEQVIISGKKALLENENSKLLDSYQISDMYMYIARSYAVLANKAEAMAWLQRLEDSGDIEKMDYKSASLFFQNISAVYFLLGDYKEGIPYIEKAIAVIEPQAKDYGDSAIILNAYITITNVHTMLGDFLTAKKYLEKASHYEYNLYYAIAYDNLVGRGISDEDGLINTAKALKLLLKGFEPASVYENPSTNLPCDDASFVVRFLTTKCLFLYRLAYKNSPPDLYLLEKGLETADTALAFYEKANFGQMYELSRFINKEQSYAPILINTFGIAAKIYLESPTAGNLDRAFDYIERSKSLVLSQALVAEQLPEPLATQKNDLIRQVLMLQQKIATERGDKKMYEDELYAVSQRLEIFTEGVKLKYPQMFSLSKTPTVKLQTLASSLDEETTIVHLFSASKFLYFITIDAQQQQLYEQPIDASFRKEIQDFVLLIKNPLLVQEAYRNDFIDQSHALYQKLIAPIAANLAGKKRVIFITDEYTAYLPFEVLLPTNEKKPYHELDFLIKNFDISYQYSGTIYHHLQQKTPILDKSLLAFAPVFENQKAAETAQRSLTTLFPDDQTEGIIQLPKSETEVKTIAQTVKEQGGKTKVLLKAGALKNNLQKELYAAPHQFVHIATHGVVNFEDPKFSAVVCHETKGNIEDNFLFVNEVQMQPIAADLVVLSSCESGIGRSVIGEGLLALNRSFIYAGANNVMFSLWKVSDEQTANLMIDFYRFYFEQKNYTAALRLAKLNMLKDPISANPRYWAAFLLMGR